MSHVIRTTTPFISTDLLCEALDSMHIGYTLQGKNIVTDLSDYYGKQTFCYSETSGKYLFRHDSSANGRYSPYPWEMDVNQWGTVSNFLQAVDAEYNKAYDRMIERLEEEKRREEERRRKEYVENQKKMIMEKAKAKGYSIKETRRGDKIRLVLVRTKY